jgi:lincosamide nucleotidyltransferase B/F
MTTKELLIQRLEAIARSVEASGHAGALIGLGSVGVERDRLDEYSDLDFFVIADDGFKQRYIENLDWLPSVHPVAYHFHNTPDGHKLLFADGVFCEFAVFEAAELPRIPFALGRVIWKRPEVEDKICVPPNPPARPSARDTEWLVGEALTNLYVGLCRYRRGEKLSAERLVQHCAVDRLLELAVLVETETAAPRDAFSDERRAERRLPAFAEVLPDFIQGYRQTPESARAILHWLEKHFQINRPMAQAIRHLCDDSS